MRWLDVLVDFSSFDGCNCHNEEEAMATTKIQKICEDLRMGVELVDPLIESNESNQEKQSVDDTDNGKTIETYLRLMYEIQRFRLMVLQPHVLL